MQVEETVNRRFNFYLNKKVRFLAGQMICSKDLKRLCVIYDSSPLQGHNGSIKIERKPDDRTHIVVPKLEIKVKIDGSTKTGQVKDLKQLSGDAAIKFYFSRASYSFRLYAGACKFGASTSMPERFETTVVSGMLGH